MVAKLSASLLALLLLLISAGCPQEQTADSGREPGSVSADKNVAGAVGSSSTIAMERPNILLVTIDTLRADYLGCYGNSGVNTPVIDRLASEGARFTFCVAHNVTTLPSHANIMTSTDARVHGVHDNLGFRLQPESLTLAEVLKEAGYDTAAFIGAFVLDSRFGLDQGFDLYDDYLERSEEQKFAVAERLAEKVVQPALGWIAKRKENPWFAWVHLYDPHSPRYVPPPLDDEYTDNPYAGEVSYVDYALGPLFEHLRSGGLIDKTMVVITSDHGEGLGDHGELAHGVFAYNTTLWVPLIIRAPWLIARSAVIERRVRHIDLLPTILEIAKAPIPPSAQGESLIGLFGGKELPPVPNSYFQALSASFHRGWAPLYGVFHDNWKFIDLPIPELYNMSNDLQESTNLITRKAGTARLLKSILQGMIDDEKSSTSARHQLSNEARRRLQSLGYFSGLPLPEKERYGVEDDPKRLIELDAMLERAGDAASDENWGLAQEILLAVVAERPRMSFTYFILGPILVKSGKPEEAIALLERAMGKGITERAVVYQLAQTLISVGREERALTLLQTLYERNREDLEVAHLLAYRLSQSGENGRAKEIYIRILKQDPTFAPARNDYGWLLLGQERFSEAMEQFDAAVEYLPEFAQALYGRGLIYERYQRWQDAIENNRLALEAKPQLHDARLRLGLVLIRVRQVKEAKEHLNRFLAEAPEDDFEKEREMVIRVLADLRRRGL